ncbi:MAG: VWA domain-containing protein, partial [Holophagales bacterium]|nr:VWA domain-containing protein [Holophagales bacterium]
LLYLVDASGSMTAPIPGSTSKLAAVASAIADTNTALAASFPGSRAALVSYRGAVFPDPVFNLSQGAQVAQGLTTNLAAVTAAAAAIDPTQIHPDSNTPAPIALDATTDLLQSTVAAGALPVVLWLTDGAPNIDIQGQGPLEYLFPEILGLDIRDTGGDFLSFGQVAWLGNWNGGIGTFDGEVFANTMYQIERLENTVPDALIYPIAVRGADTYYEDLLAYAAYFSGTRLVLADDATQLTAGLAGVLDELDCGATIGDLVWHDADADGAVSGGEVGLGGVTVELRDASNAVVATEVTGTDGSYLFENVIPGTYTVTVDPSTLPAPFTSPTYDLDGTGTPNAASVTVIAQEVRLDVDFGYRGVATVGDRIWLDENGDGVQDGGEIGLAGAAVERRDGADVLLATAVTGPDGEYLFADLPAGSYTVVVDATTLPAEVDGPSYDLDGIVSPNRATLTVAEGDIRLDVDFGYLPAITCVEGVYRDNFDVPSFGNQDGTLDWSGDWLEDDPYGQGVGGGQVEVHGGLLTLEDRPDSGEEPGVQRSADLSNAQRAVLSFRFITSQGVDPDDEVTVDVSSDGGTSWTVLEEIHGIDGSGAFVRSYDITGFASEETRVRLRVTNKYGGEDEVFCLDWLEIAVECTECTSRTVRDDFSRKSFANNDGPDPWTAQWQENDSAGAGPRDGAVRVDSSGFLTFQMEEKAPTPSMAREVNLSGAAAAILAFEVVTSSGTDPGDAFFVEASSDGGATWTVIDTVDGIDGYAELSFSYQLAAFISERTQVRFRVADGSYQGNNEAFCLDWVVILSLCEGEELLGSISGKVWKDGNGNGVQENPANGLGGVKVKLVRDGGGTLATAWTDSSGAYVFDDMPLGTYVVKVKASTLPAGIDHPTYDLDGIDTPDRSVVPLAAGQNREDVRFGYRPLP